MTWEMVIGLETHVEQATRTKIFCSCTTEFGGAPNTHCCPVCTGMPGTLPVVNRKVVKFAVKAGLALSWDITRYNKFDRKNYFYPDLPKAYQVSQLYLPIARDGHVSIRTEAGEKDIRIHELRMEEDAGKLVHDPWIDQTKCDYNRCGVPLIEIVTEPDFHSADEVIAYLEKLKSTLEYLGVSDGKMQEGLRAEQPEMAETRKLRYQAQYGLPEYDAGILTGRKALADFFEETVALGAPAKEVSNWMLGDLMRRLKDEELEPKHMKLTPANLAKLIQLIVDGKINRNTAAKVFRAIFPDDTDAEEYVKAHSLEQVSGAGLVAAVVERVSGANAAAAADYRAGNPKAMGFLVRQVIKVLKGKADPKTVNQTVREKLENRRAATP